MLRPHADAASTSWGAREDLGQGSNFESFLPVRSRLAPTHRWLVAIGQERVQERLCKGPASTCDSCSSNTDLADLGQHIRKPQPDWRVSSHPVAWSTTAPRWNGQTAGIGSCGCQCDVPTLPPCGKNKRDKAYWPPLQWFKKQSKKQRDRAKAMAV